MNPSTRAEIRSGLSRMSGLSPAVQAILPRLGDDTFDVNELGCMVLQDPMLAARVLHLANSPFYGLPRQVGSLREAVLILGFSNLRSVVLSTGMIGVFPDGEGVSHSLATAAAARSLAISLGMDQGMAYTAGLLHNLGALLMGHFSPDHWQALAGESPLEGDGRLMKERQTFGFDHCELGAEIAGDWHFPAAIRAAIRLHRRPPDEPGEGLTDLVHGAGVSGSPSGGRLGSSRGDAGFYFGGRPVACARQCRVATSQRRAAAGCFGLQDGAEHLSAGLRWCRCWAQIRATARTSRPASAWRPVRCRAADARCNAGDHAGTSDTFSATSGKGKARRPSM